jgi:hypothetical protein
MPPAGATVLCADVGQAQPTAPNPRILVCGQPTVLLTAPWVVSGCAMPPPTAGNGPCVTAQVITGSVRGAVAGPTAGADGQPVVHRSHRHAAGPGGCADRDDRAMTGQGAFAVDHPFRFGGVGLTARAGRAAHVCDLI